jgi:hypothetical protein
MTQEPQANPKLSKKDEIIRQMVDLGYEPHKTAFEITYANLAQYLAEVLERFQVPDEVVTDAFVSGLIEQAEKALHNSDALQWPYVLYVIFEEGVPEQYRQWPEPDIEPDEGPLTEQYENSTRLGDDEGYYPGCGDYDDDF